MLRTNIEIDERLMNKAMKLTHTKTRKALVHLAVSELVQKKERKKLLQCEGQVEWDGNLREIRRTRHDAR